jgi:hypothetical protein
MSSTCNSIFQAGFVPFWRSIGRRPLGARTLGDWMAVAVARLKEVAPYALLELLLPGGSVVALTLWFYRRRKRLPPSARSLNALL